ncbi:hypothetical protein JMN32_15545 [Fulvivirga sp. 29W222]|uniref:Uncharacterized protein n=1 Tax=Fulvivirga marina TaxID=2494733 RepID=A0A937FZJ2_9BACT|nr:hypothetical protein [Fulvivirga marina]MBL6447732.1 hypothetical protein [Fulvivirga marina]
MNNIRTIKYWARLSFIYLILVGFLGCLLRLIFFFPITGINFKYFLHGHSHLAFLGWIFNALFAALIFTYIPKKTKSYKVLFWLLQIAVIGMLITFPLQGYAAASITFSTLHILLSYWFAGKFFRDTKTLTSIPFSLLFVRWGLLFMVLSSIGPFALGAIMAKGLGGSNLYQLAIYFYLHFQYDGWFSFAVFGLFFRILEVNNIAFNRHHARCFLWLMAMACIPAYSLSTLWTQPGVWVYIIGFLSAFLQVVALIYLVLLLRGTKNNLLTSLKPWTRYLLWFAFIALLIKLFLQFVSAFPAVADLAYSVRNFTIGYLHIVFLGFVSTFLMGWFNHTELININARIPKTGIALFLTGFILSETIVFLQPTLFMTGFGMLPFYFEGLFGVSLLMPVGCLMVMGQQSEVTG